MPCYQIHARLPLRLEVLSSFPGLSQAMIIYGKFRGQHPDFAICGVHYGAEIAARYNRVEYTRNEVRLDASHPAVLRVVQGYH